MAIRKSGSEGDYTVGGNEFLTTSLPELIRASLMEYPSLASSLFSPSPLLVWDCWAWQPIPLKGGKKKSVSGKFWGSKRKHSPTVVERIFQHAAGLYLHCRTFKLPHQ
ncbi:MAG: hypothetical protein ABIR06_02340 [Cyclobacteriaceae bacterium]